MRTQRQRRIRIGILGAMLLSAVVAFIPGCAGKNPPTIAAGVATHGTTLMQAVKTTQQAVIDAEAKGLIPRNAAVKSMETFQAIGARGEEVAKLLNTLISLPSGSTEATGTIDKVQQALDLIDSQLFTALVPIGDEGTRERIGKLAAEVSKTISLINRQLLGSQ